ncbi:MAG: FAD-dependent oxidoreductase [Anaerolineae bacterium]|nr:FAD-dependent oxidoreductase [Anaerolineae bacterium]NIN96774.1 FAD-dependent oxidoreductase [Anaerolineae bacterium]NIQ79770.1 FAD-dependent oxidoreductase [Anaerolineae bacterium]
MTDNERPQVVIAGAGFGGLSAARTLARSPVDVMLIDRNNYHTFPPLLYQVAAGELEPGDIAYPVRTILRKIPNARFTMAEVKRVDLERRIVETEGPEFPYDFLILATGTVDHFLMVPGGPEHAFSLKTLEQAIALRNHILGCVEQADYEAVEERRRGLLAFAVVGGGPTGVETAGALAELIQGPLMKDCQSLDFNEVRIVLIEATDRLLPTLPEPLGIYAAKRLREMGVEIRLQSLVDRITSESLYLQDGAVIPACTTVWAAGVRGEPLAQASGLPTARRGRVTVLPTLQVPDHPEVYVIGDLAYFEQDGSPLAMVAQVALQGGEAAARNIQRQLAGQEPLPFRYHDRGTMATIGRNHAAAYAFGRNFTGFPAWILWLTIHLSYLIGFRNRLLVLINWARHYFFREHAACRILPSEPVPREVGKLAEEAD